MASLNGKPVDVQSDRFLDLFAALAAPFDGPGEVKVRSQGGKQFHYITARTAMNRLDDVLGPAGWWDEYTPYADSVLCKLTIRLPDGSTLTKCDAGGFAGMADSGDNDKSGYSDAFKRAAVKFGVSRYLYQDGVPKFVREYVGQTAPAAEPAPVRRPEVHAPRSNRSPDGPMTEGGPPRSGKALWRWALEQEEAGSEGLRWQFVRFGRAHQYPERIIDWDSNQTAAALATVMTAGRNGHQNPDADDIEEGEER